MLIYSKINQNGETKIYGTKNNIPSSSDSEVKLYDKYGNEVDMDSDIVTHLYNEKQVDGYRFVTCSDTIFNRKDIDAKFDDVSVFNTLYNLVFYNEDGTIFDAMYTSPVNPEIHYPTIQPIKPGATFIGWSKSLDEIREAILENNVVNVLPLFEDNILVTCAITNYARVSGAINVITSVAPTNIVNMIRHGVLTSSAETYYEGKFDDPEHYSPQKFTTRVKSSNTFTGLQFEGSANDDNLLCAYVIYEDSAGNTQVSYSGIVLVEGVA